MAQTPDHRPGTAYYGDLALILQDTASTASTAVGAITYANALYQLTDGLGSYDPRTVYQLTHTTLADLIHYLDDGPAINGAYRTTQYATGTPFVSGYIWWTSNAQTLRVVDRTITYPASSFLVPTNDVWRVYTAAGAVAHTVTDTMSYSGISETARSRVYS